MSRRAVFVYDDALSHHVLREGHVMIPTRLRYTYELVQAYDAFALANASLVQPRHATQEELLSSHTPAYVEAVHAFSRGERLEEVHRFNFSQEGDNPTYPGMYEAATLSTGGSLVAAQLLLDGAAEVAFNSAGGLHHAMAGRASGFCVFNDPVVAIRHLVERGLKVAYVDIDAHHGDGVQNAFYDSDAVLTVSLHEAGTFLFPGTGFAEELGQGRGRGYAVNVPLSPYTEDDTYLWAFRQVVPPLLEAFGPDVLATQLGMDTHFNDPITHLCLTVQGHAQVVRELGALSPGRWLAFGGGGYDMSAVARGWAMDYGVMLERDWPDEIPASYLEQYGLQQLRDSQGPEVTASRRAEARRYAEETVRQVQRQVFPLHGVQSG